MKRTFIVLTMISILSKVLGFCREILMSCFFGASVYTDIYLMAGSAANVLLGWLSGFAIIHTPLYQTLKEKNGRRIAERFTNQILLIQIFLGVAVLVLFHFWGGQFIRYMARGFSREKLHMTGQFFIWCAAGTVIAGSSSVIISELSCDGKLILSNVTSLVVSISQMAVIWISAVFDHYSYLRFAGFISAVLQMAALMYILYKKGRDKTCFPLMKEVGLFFSLILPVFVSSMMDEVNAFVDKMFGSQLPEGSISALNYAHMVKQLFFYVFAASLVTIIYPDISNDVARQDDEKVCRRVNAGLGYMYIIFAFITIFVAFHAKNMIEFIYMRGKFDTQAVRMTSECLEMYAIALLPLAVREILVRTCQAYQDTKANMYAGAVSVLVNIVLNFILVRIMLHKGLALSTSIASIVGIPLLVILTKKKNPRVYDHEVLKVSVITIFGAGVSVSVVYYFISGLYTVSDLPVIRMCCIILSFIFSGIVYMAILYISNVQLVRALIRDGMQRLTKHV